MSAPTVTVYTPPAQVCQKCRMTQRSLDTHGIAYEVAELDDVRREHYLGLGVMVAPIVEVSGQDQVAEVADLLGLRTTEVGGCTVGFFNDMRPDVIERLAQLPSMKQEVAPIAA